MQSVLDALIGLAGVQVKVRLRDDLLRPTEPHRMLVRIERLQARTGWQPRYPLDRTLRDILDYWSNAI
jgi:GDP-4-dehydro-6-deoxy-D-mannose reductase